jgi:DNA repair photolyase
MPGINDHPAAVREIVARAREAGARNVTPIALHLRSGVREVFMDWLAAERPDLVERYGELYGRGAYLPTQERRRLGELVRPSGRSRPSTAPRFERSLERGRERHQSERVTPQASLF